MNLNTLRTGLLGALLGFSVVNLEAQLVLNELLASNQGVVENGSDNPDYVEIYNPGNLAVSLDGFSLSDDPALPRKFVFPGGNTIPPGGYLVVWCDTATTSPGIHTGFGLSASGETIRLIAANGVTVVDEITFGLQVPNLSIGRIRNGAGTWSLNQPTPGASNQAQPTGDSSGLRINEWMARPATGPDWLEVYNSLNVPVDISGFIITDSTGSNPSNRPIPNLSFIEGHGFRQFFASDLELTAADHLDFRLSGTSETLSIYTRNAAALLDRLSYGAQQEDTSQGRSPDGSSTIAFFQAGRPTPGAPNLRQLTSVVISEVLAHTDPPLEDAIELHNTTGAPVDISHWWLSDSASQPQRYRIPAGTILAAQGYDVFYAYQFGEGPDGFLLNASEGEAIYLSVGDAAGNLTGEQGVVSFGGTKNGVSVGRVVTTAGNDFVPLASRTFGVDNPQTNPQFRQGEGAPNSPPRVGPVVITEIMFHPPDVGGQANPTDEFIELHNPNTFPVPLYHPEFTANTWRLRDGITFEFPAGQVIAPGGHLLVVDFSPVLAPAQLAAFREKFSIPAQVPIVGPYSGRLNNAGETIDLLWPDNPEGPVSPNPGFVPYELVERIRYSNAAPWPVGASGTGLSLQRSQSSAYGNEPANWTVAAPTPGTSPGAPAEILLSARLEGGAIRLQFTPAPGRSHQVQAAPSLPAAIWNTLTTLPPSAEPQEFSVPLEGGHRFFRILAQ